MPGLNNSQLFGQLAADPFADNYFTWPEFIKALHLQGGNTIMSEIKKVKVVKKLDAAASKKKVMPAKPARIKAREVVSTVSEWVADLRSRKSEETKAAFDSLFAGRARPSES